jgi:hypothetical protein
MQTRIITAVFFAFVSLTASPKLTTTSLWTVRSALAQDNTDSNENANREACRNSGGKYLWGAPAPRCKCLQAGMINNWTRADEKMAADICIPDPKAKKTDGAPKKHHAAKAVAVQPPPEPEDVVVTLDPSVTPSVANDKSVQVKVTVTGIPGAKHGKKTVYPDLIVHESCNGCLTESGKTTRDTAIAGGTVGDGRAEKLVTLTAFDKKGGEGSFTATVTVMKKDYPSAAAKMGWDPVKTPCEVSGGGDLPGEHCKCPPGQDEQLLNGNYVCRKHVPTACENSGGENLPGDHCKCSDPTKMEGVVDGKWVCVPKPELPKPVVEKGEQGEPGQSGVIAHLTFGITPIALKSSSFQALPVVFAAGLILQVSEIVDAYGQFGVGGPGAKKFDADGNAIQNKYLSGLVEGGLKFWLTDYFGLRVGAVYVPIGITDAFRFLQAGVGAVGGIEFQIPLAGNFVFLPSLTGFVGEHLGHNRDVAGGAMLNLTFGYGGYGQKSASAADEEPSPPAPADKKAEPKPESEPNPAPTKTSQAPSAPSGARNATGEDPFEKGTL